MEWSYEYSRNVKNYRIGDTKMNKIYLDNAATTMVAPEVVKVMLPYFTNYYGNASEPHSWGIEASNAIEKAREIIANFLGADSAEIIFTSCSTESINLSHKGLLESMKNKHVITTPIEHKAVLEALKHSKAKVTYLPVDKYGLVKVEDVKKAIRPDTVLVSIMYVNNEIGTIEPVKEIGEMLKKYNLKHKTHIYFHIDATQAIQYLPCKVDELNVDLLSFTGHKIHAPKGIGALYIRSFTPIARQQDGGGQELGLRAGTENVPYIVGLGKAIELTKKVEKQKIYKLRDELLEKILQIPDTQMTGAYPNLGRVPHIASFVFKGLRGDELLLALSKKGIACASGSACTAGSMEPSHVLKAIGLTDEWAIGSVRFSLSKYTTLKEVQIVEKELKMIVNKLRGKI